ncbi:MAG: hypothetical protein Q9M19_04840 [Mariprofundaceae bacterium]|nr:hypothetical protein [Mariprofundaceae bacterium]
MGSNFGNTTDPAAGGNLDSAQARGKWNYLKEVLDNIFNQNLSDSALTTFKNDWVVNAHIASGAVKTGNLSTATGSASAAASSLQVSVHEYGFFPTTWGQSMNPYGYTIDADIRAYQKTDPGTTNPRFTLYTGGTSPNLGARWRYITASDNPRLYVAVCDTHVIGVWEAEDPANEEEDVPLAVVGCEVYRIDIASLRSTLSDVSRMYDETCRVCERKGWQMSERHWPFRALRLLTRDRVAEWIMKWCDFDKQSGCLIKRNTERVEFPDVSAMLRGIPRGIFPDSSEVVPRV